jgi:UDP-N-acetyl-D-mannosaminuronic acid dehydrogenase
MAFPNVCVMGLGYIGLPTASLLATKGFLVHGVDVNAHAVETINQGNIHIHEPDLDVMVRAAVNSGNLRAATEPIQADVFIIAVPTPIRPDKSPDLSFVEAAARKIAPFVAEGNLVVLESTSPVGTTERVCEWMAEGRTDLAFPRRETAFSVTEGEPRQVFVAHCPERVLPGQILRELVENDRVIGGVDRASTEKTLEFYGAFVRGELLATDSRTAEMCKLTENAFRDVNIAFANELSVLGDALGVDPWELISLANCHPRVSILQPGPGVGGHCIAIDPWFIVHSKPELARLIRTAREVNDSKPEWVVAKIRQRAERFKEPVVACLGLAFKADVDDLRESPSVEIVRALAESGVGRVLVVEPHIHELPPSLEDMGVEMTDLASAIAAADIVVLLVDHKPFMRLDQAVLRDKIVIDTRGAWR